MEGNNAAQKYILTQARDEKYLIKSRVIRWYGVALLMLCSLIITIYSVLVFVRHQDIDPYQRMLIAIFAVFPVGMIMGFFSKVVKCGIYSWVRVWEIVIKGLVSLSLMILLTQFAQESSLSSIIKSVQLVSIFAIPLIFTIFLRYLFKASGEYHNYEISCTAGLVDLVKDLRNIGLKLARREGDVIYFHIDKLAILNFEYIVFERKDHFLLLADKILKDELIAMPSEQDCSIKNMQSLE